MALAPDPRADSAHLTKTFYDQLRSSKDNFLMDGQELTLDHVNRLSTEPEGDTDTYPQDKHGRGSNSVRNPCNDSGEDLLALDSEDAENWLVPSPGASTGTHTGSQTPHSLLDDQELSVFSQETSANKRAKTHNTGNNTPASTRATMRSAGTPASTSSTARAPFTPTGSESAKPRVARTSSKRQAAGEPPSTPETPPTSTNPNSRIPKPSPTYSSPNKSEGGGSYPAASPGAASRIPRPPTPLEAQASSSEASSTLRGPNPRADSASSMRPGVSTGSRQMKPARDHSQKFSEMWGTGNQRLVGRTSSKRRATHPSLVPSQIPGDAASPQQVPESPSQIPSPQKLDSTSAQHGDTEMLNAERGPDAGMVPESKDAASQEQPPPRVPHRTLASEPVSSSDNSDVPISHVQEPGSLPASSLTPRRSIGQDSDSSNRSTTFGDRSRGGGSFGGQWTSGSKPWQKPAQKSKPAAGSTSSATGGVVNPPWTNICPPGSRSDDVDIYVPTTQRNKELRTPAETLLHEEGTSGVQPGIFAQAMEADKEKSPTHHTRSPSNPSPPIGPLTAAHAAWPQNQDPDQQPGEAAGSPPMLGQQQSPRELPGVGSFKSQSRPAANVKPGGTGEKQGGCCGCCIM